MKMPNSYVLAALERAERRSRGEDPFYSPSPRSAPEPKKRGGKQSDIGRLLFDAYEHIRLGSAASKISRKDILRRLEAALTKERKPW